MENFVPINPEQKDALLRDTSMKLRVLIMNPNFTFVEMLGMLEFAKHEVVSSLDYYAKLKALEDYLDPDYENKLKLNNSIMDLFKKSNPPEKE